MRLGCRDFWPKYLYLLTSNIEVWVCWVHLDLLDLTNAFMRQGQLLPNWLMGCRSQLFLHLATCIQLSHQNDILWSSLAHFDFCILNRRLLCCFPNTDGNHFYIFQIDRWCLVDLHIRQPWKACLKFVVPKFIFLQELFRSGKVFCLSTTSLLNCRRS